MCSAKKLFLVVLFVPVAFFGCHKSAAPPSDIQSTVTRRSDVIDATMPCDPMLSAARSLTQLEDELRDDGTITVKSPDVWGEGNLIHSIQEFDSILAEKVKTDFEKSLQGARAESDTRLAQFETEGGVGIGGVTPPTSTATALTVTASGPSAILKASKDQFAPEKSDLSLEPTEFERQRAAFIYVSQSLRRRNLGDDNSRNAAYRMYLFRIPISILPGVETSQGHAAVVTLRAKPRITKAV